MFMIRVLLTNAFYRAIHRTYAMSDAIATTVTFIFLNTPLRA